MRLPQWLDIALEGGGFELERGLVRYVGLRRLLKGDWRRRASEVASSCDALARDEEKLEAAELRAARRARVDPRAGSARALAALVARERLRLDQVLVDLGIQGEGFATRLQELGTTAQDESHLERTWRSWHGQRVIGTTLLLAGMGAIPVTSWMRASYFGELATVVDGEGLDDVALPFVVATVVLLLVLTVRLNRYSWLGLRVPWPGLSAGVALYSVIACVAGAAQAYHSPWMLVVAVVALSLTTAQMLYALWVLPSDPLLGPLSEGFQAASSSSTGEKPAASQEAST
jgi:hypothetical protein